MAISERIKNLCHEMLVDFTPTQAARRAGMTEKTARSHVYQILQRKEVAEYLAKIAKAQAEKINLTAEKVLHEISCIAFADITSYYKYIEPINDQKGRWALKSLDELTKNQRAAIAEYYPGKYIKLHSKDAALDKLGKYFKLYTDIDATINNLFVLAPIKYGGKEVIFDVGKAAPKVIATPAPKDIDKSS